MSSQANVEFVSNNCGSLTCRLLMLVFQEPKLQEVYAVAQTNACIPQYIDVHLQGIKLMKGEGKQPCCKQRH